MRSAAQNRPYLTQIAKNVGVHVSSYEFQSIIDEKELDCPESVFYVHEC